MTENEISMDRALQAMGTILRDKKRSFLFGSAVLRIRLKNIGVDFHANDIDGVSQIDEEFLNVSEELENLSDMKFVRINRPWGSYPDSDARIINGFFAASHHRESSVSGKAFAPRGACLEFVDAGSRYVGPHVLGNVARDNGIELLESSLGTFPVADLETELKIYLPIAGTCSSNPIVFSERIIKLALVCLVNNHREGHHAILQNKSVVTNFRSTNSGYKDMLRFLERNSCLLHIAIRELLRKVEGGQLLRNRIG